MSPGLAGDVLAVLAGTTRPLTGREVARLARRGSPRGVLTALDRLVEQGLVARAEAGRAMLYTLNRDHVAAPAAVALAQLRSEVVERARREVAAWQIAAQHASVFGSFARGDGDVGSDIDLFVVRPAGVSADDADWREQLDRLAERVRAWTGNHASIAEVASDDLARLREDRPLIVDELSADAIALAGPEALQLFERDAR